MDFLSIIDKKRLGLHLTNEELDFMFNGYLNKKIEDYQMSSFLMSICINGMDIDEIVYLTDLMLNSGQRLDLMNKFPLTVDKHSTGGIGDKTSIIIGPILASLGLKMGKLSGRGLGITGGTIDKLESIPGFRVSLSTEEFLYNLDKVGFTLMSQTPDMTPLDKVIYDLRNASGTVSSIPLIASSIMSKKLAIGAKYILIDLKVGSGALIKNKIDANELAEIMIKIGKRYDRVVIPVITDMDTPLGDNIGNALEVLEAIDILNGKRGELRDLCVLLSSILYSHAKGESIGEAQKKVIASLDNGAAFSKFLEFVKTQGGNIEKIETSKIVKDILSNADGTIKRIDAESIGKLSLHLGAGKEKMTDIIDFGVGIVLNKKIGDVVKKGDILCHLYQKNDEDFSEEALNCFEIVQ